MTFKLRDYQREIADKGIAILKKYGLVYLAMQPRVGKSLTALEIARLYGAKNVLFITKLKAIKSIEDDYKFFNPGFRILVINYEYIHKVEWNFDLVICDESHCCFPEGTLVDGKKIEDIDLHTSLKSYNLDSNTIEDDVVINKFERENTDGWVRLKINNKEIICTPDHLFLSKRGWIEANKITNEDELFTLQ